MQKTKLLPYLEALFAVVVWGGSFIATKIAVGQISPIAVVWLRFAMGIPLILFAVIIRKQFAFPKGNEWLYFILLGFLGITLHQWLQSNGLQTAQATTTAWIVSSSPVFIAILGWLILKEKLNLLQSFGIVLSMIGVLAIVSKGNLSTLAIGKFGTIGDFLILISSVNWAVFSIISRRGLKDHPSTRLTFWVMTIGWLITSVAFFANKSYIEIPQLDNQGWWAMIFLGILTTGLAYIAWFDALSQLTAAQTGAFLFVEPLASMIFAAIILNEHITLASVLGGAVILVGVWLVNRTTPTSNEGKLVMKASATKNAKVEKTENGWRLVIQKGDSLSYRDAQLDDYSQLPRHKFPHHSLTLSLRAKTSSNSITGTWGFGLWNDPFGMSLGFGGSPFRLPALPNAVWFFSASPQNHLSFTNDKPAQGFLAQTFCSPKFHPLLILAGLVLPFSRKTARKLLSKVINEDGVALSVDVTQWHGYRLEWSPTRVLFYVDNVLVFESPVNPNPPLGVIIWIDNQYAAFTPEGKIAFGVLEGGDEWLEIEDIVISEK